MCTHHQVQAGRFRKHWLAAGPAARARSPAPRSGARLEGARDGDHLPHPRREGGPVPRSEGLDELPLRPLPDGQRFPKDPLTLGGDRRDPLALISAGQDLQVALPLERAYGPIEGRPIEEQALRQPARAGLPSGQRRPGRRRRASRWHGPPVEDPRTRTPPPLSRREGSPARGAGAPSRMMYTHLQAARQAACGVHRIIRAAAAPGGGPAQAFKYSLNQSVQRFQASAAAAAL
jgi:hypothetical protein